MSNPERQRKIESYGQAYSTLMEGLKEFPRAMWTFRPAPNQWSIHETVIHIADSEANSYVRCRCLIAEPGSTVMGYDEMQWASALQYHAQNVEAALELFKVLRAASHTLIRSVPEATWANTVTHTQSGVMTMDEWLDIYERHVPEHLAQMRAVYAAWQASNPKGL